MSTDAKTEKLTVRQKVGRGALAFGKWAAVKIIQLVVAKEAPILLPLFMAEIEAIVKKGLKK